MKKNSKKGREHCLSRRLAGMLIAGILTLSEVTGMLAVPVQAMAQESETDLGLADVEQGLKEDEKALADNEQGLTDAGQSYTSADQSIADADNTLAIDDYDGVDDKESQSADPDMIVYADDVSDGETDNVMITDETIMSEDGITDSVTDQVNPDDYVYVEQTSYRIKFLILKDGKILEYDYFNSTSSDSALPGVIGASKLNELQSLASPNVITGWMITQNGRHESYTDDLNSYTIKPKMDYTFTAVMKRALADDMNIVITPAVYFDGKSHVSTAEPFTLKKAKSSINDLQISVLDDYGSYLRYGTDYKVTYKNNINASMKINDDGAYERLSLPDSKRPQVQITGIGNYAGFSATAFFDILPYNFGEKNSYSFNGNFCGWISGVKTSYTLKAGKALNSEIKPTITCYNYYSGKTTTLKQGKDYVLRFYRYNEAGKWIYETSVDKTGRWLCTARGIGNYCGTVFGQYIDSSNAVFNDGTQGATLNPAVCDYKGSDVPAGQFKVDAGDKDLSKATVTIKKASVKYKHGTYYTGDYSSLGIVVKLDGYTLNEGVDYKVVYDGNDFMYVRGLNLSNNVYQTDTHSAVFENRIWMANTYKVIIEAIDNNPSGYYGSCTAKKKVTINGVKINPKWFLISTASKKYDGQYGGGGSFKYSWDCGVGFAETDTLMYGHYTDSGTLRTYDYMGGLEDIFNSSYKTGKSYDYAVQLFTEYSKLPGTYSRTVVPLGPGVNRGANTHVNFKINAISMKEGLKKNLIKITAGEAEYNAGGAFPGSLSIYFNGNLNNVTMSYNNQSFYLTDKDGDSTRVILTATNNTSTGTAYLTVKGDGKVFKGSVAKAASYNVKTKNVSVSNIHVLEDSDYAIVYGKKTDTVYTSSSNPVGTLYATCEAVKADGTTPKYKIDLYQSYYADEEGYYADRAKLKKLSPNQYKLNLAGTGTYKVIVTSAADSKKAGLFFAGAPELDKNYSVFDEAVTILSATVTYKGKDYTLPADAKTLAVDYTGSQIRFSDVKNVTIKSSSGEVTLTPDYFDVVYGDNLVAGKNKGSMTVILKKGSSGFKYGGSKKFTFNINAKANQVI